MPTVVRDMGTAVGRSVVVLIAAFVIGVPLGLCGIFTTLSLVSSSEGSPWVIALVALMWLIPFGIGFGLLALSVRRRSSELDALFVPLGLQGSAFQTFFRQYHGTLYGREVDIYLWRGPFLQIEVQTPVQTRMGVTSYQSDTGFFAELAGRTPIAFSQPELSALMVFASDEQWARALMSDRNASDAIRRMTALGSSVFTRQQLVIRPGVFSLLLSGNRDLFRLRIDPIQARLWVDDLVRTVQAAETLAPPTIVEEITSVERLGHDVRRANPYLALWIGLGIAGAIVAIGVAITLLLLAVGQ